MTDAAGTLNVELAVKGMTCASCSARLERALKARQGVLSAEVHLVTERAQLRVVPGTTLEFLCEAIEDAGFSAAPVPKQRRLVLGEDEEAEYARISRRDGWLLLASAALSLPLVAPMLLMVFGQHVHLSPWVEFALASPVQFLLGARFYVAGYKAARHGSGNMDLLVAIGTSAAYVYSTFLLFSAASGSLASSGSIVGADAAQGTLYFEAAAVVITLVRFGKWLEAKAKRGTTAALRQLMMLQPERVRVQRTSLVDSKPVTSEADVSIDEVDIGSILVVRPGERFGTDGIIVEGSAAIDESLVTGESEPVTRGPGEEIVAGSLNTDGLVLVQVSKVGEDSTLGRIIGLVYGAQAGKANVQRLVDRVSQVFVPAVLVIAVVTFLGWFFSTGQLAPSLVAAVSVLVIACPCALGLATPTAIVAGTGAAAKAGILVRDVDTLERASQIDTVVFDKTGTLTLGRPTVSRIAVLEGSEEQLLALAAAVEQASLHPLATAVVNAAKERSLLMAPISDFRSHTGSGVAALVDGKLVRVGSFDWLGLCGVATQPRASESDESHVEVALEDQHLGTIYISDPARPSALVGLARLRERHVLSILLSGDVASSVQRLAHEVGIDEAIGRVRPEAKQSRIVALQAAGRRVAMVGDGINDAPALAAAEVGIAMGTGTQVAMQTANVVLMRPDLTLVAATLDIAQATFAKIRQNLFWAFVYNCVGIPLAAAGRLSPMIAGLAMALSSVSVVSNSLLLRRWRPRQGEVVSRPS